MVCFLVKSGLLFQSDDCGFFMAWFLDCSNLSLKNSSVTYIEVMLGHVVWLVWLVWLVCYLDIPVQREILQIFPKKYVRNTITDRLSDE